MCITMNKTILFDFDGTLADSLGVVIEITNELAPDLGFAQIAAEQVDDFKKMSSREIIQLSGISLWRIPFLMRRFQTGFQRKAKDVKLFPGIDRLLRDLKQEGYRLGIVSSNSVENIQAVLHHHEVANLFSFVQSCSVFGKGRALRSAMRANYIQPATAFYVGDEIRDIEAARRSNLSTISVTWGFNSADVLSKQQPDYLVDTPGEILELLKS
jgi:phosphoglycolate phosphatase